MNDENLNRDGDAAAPGEEVVPAADAPVAGDEDAAAAPQPEGAVEGDPKPHDEVSDARGVVKTAEENSGKDGDGTAVRKFRVMGEGSLEIDGTEYQPGEWVELSDAQAAPYITRGRVEAYDTVAGDAPVPTKPEPGAPPADRDEDKA